jgi:hypothetical protein
MRQSVNTLIHLNCIDLSGTQTPPQMEGLQGKPARFRLTTSGIFVIKMVSRFRDVVGHKTT